MTSTDAQTETEARADKHESAAEPVTAAVHENSWSANLETLEYADDSGLAVDDALDAIAHTAAGYHVNLVTHGDLGHPADFLYDVLADADHEIAWEYVDQCGCGGHVTRVDVQ